MARGRVLTVLGFLLLGCQLSAGAFAQTAAKPTTAAKAPAAAADKSAAIPADGAALEYVGAEVCKTCHEDLYNGWE
ncbi:MAG: hypothetical protein WA875_04960, partial [Candidatus Acidiferrales bacterium]